MLELKNIHKEYKTEYSNVTALKSIDLKFRHNEFVSILGPSGCGKTTLLNIIGGLDRYTSGDLIINGKSTKEYKDKDWDTYRNHTIGFIFQSYNLIMHLTVAENVELALTLSGINEKERKEKTLEVLKKVGLEDKAKALPNQLSGGQMQRVAIARALINDPDILLADEPTGALDSTTGVQVLELLKEIAKEKLVIMVTHNPELAYKYSTRIINIKDGEIIEDSYPVVTDLTIKKDEEKVKKPSMSFWTALKLSFRNMMTKKGRTILVAFAGSIGIIGIALILSMSAGFQKYIDDIQEKTLSEYPLTISKETVDYSFIMNLVNSVTSKGSDEIDDEIKINYIVKDFMESYEENTKYNNLEPFKEFIDSNEELKELTTDIKYNYKANFSVYPENDITRVYPMSGSGMAMQFKWTEFLDNDELNENKYELIAGQWPKESDELVLILNSKGQITDIVLLMLGKVKINDLIADSNIITLQDTYQVDDFLNTKLKMLVDSDLYAKDTDYTDDIEYKKVATYTGTSTTNKTELFKILENKSSKLNIVGIIKPKSASGLDMSAYIGGIGYSSKLTNFIVEKNANSEVVKAQLASSDTNILNGTAFTNVGDDNLDDALSNLGYANVAKPNSISIFPKSFDAKNRIIEIIDEYNSQFTKEEKLTYTDEVGFMISSVSDIVDAVSYVLIAFVSVSLIVSSIMIGVITYISVLERTKEIGVLRSIGASKLDISRVFNAETLIIGFASGVMGIVVSLLLLIPINLIIGNLTGISNMGYLPLGGAIILIVISTILTLIAGIIPSRLAAKKDPVIALRSE